MALSRETIQKIKKLRERGYSIPEISRAQHIPKSTVSRHVRKVRIASAYYQRWLDRRNASKIISERNWNSAFQKIATLYNDALTENEMMLIVAMLYWAEGAKKDLSFSNTDLQMVRIFVALLRRVFDIKDEDIKISLRIYEDLDREACLQHWSKVVGFDLKKDTSINVLKGLKYGKLQYGMCRVRVKKGGWLHKEISAVVQRVCQLIPS